MNSRFIIVGKAATLPAQLARIRREGFGPGSKSTGGADVSSDISSTLPSGRLPQSVSAAASGDRA